jgi:hypothetical protein
MQIKDNIDALKKLQPLFKRVLGEWKIGDRYCYISYPKGVLTVLQLSMLPVDSNIILRIPTLEELWEMVDWDKHHFYLETCHGTVDIYIDGEVLCAECDPYTALLKALCSQEEV